MNLMQLDGSSSERKKEVNIGEVLLPFLPCALLLKTENNRVLQSGCTIREDSAEVGENQLQQRLLHEKCFCVFYLFLSSFMTEFLSDTTLRTNLYPWVLKYLFLVGYSRAADQHAAACSNLCLPFLPPSPALPSSSPPSLSFLYPYPSSFHFNQGSFLIKTNKYEEAINVLKEADGGIVPFRYCIKP